MPDRNGQTDEDLQAMMDLQNLQETVTVHGSDVAPMHPALEEPAPDTAAPPIDPAQMRGKVLTTDDIDRQMDTMLEEEIAKTPELQAKVVPQTEPSEGFTLEETPEREQAWENSPYYGVYVCESHQGHKVKIWRGPMTRDDRNNPQYREGIIASCVEIATSPHEPTIGVMNLRVHAAVRMGRKTVAELVELLEKTTSYPQYLLRWPDWELVRHARHRAKKLHDAAENMARKLHASRLLKAGVAVDEKDLPVPAELV
jgi:hypothetical protein